MINCLFVSNTQGASNSRGGGLFFTPNSTTYTGLVENCIFKDNSAAGNGGGVAVYGNNNTRFVMRNCRMDGNSAAVSGGGMSVTFHGLGASTGARIIIENCTVVNNSAATSGSGVYRYPDTATSKSYYTNMIVYHNDANSIPNINDTTSFGYSCSPDLSDGVDGNVSSDPQLLDWENGEYGLLPGSPCIDSGVNNPSWMSGAQDLDGANRIINSTVDMGAYEADSSTGPLVCNFSAPTNSGLLSLTATFTAFIAGDPSVTNITYYGWDFDNDGSIDDSGGAAKKTVDYTYSTPGSYDVSLIVSNSLGQTTNRVKLGYITVSPLTNYVSLAGGHVSPFGSWGDAATNIQDAIDAAYSGSLGSGVVVVSNGTYVIPSEMTLYKAITVQSLSGLENTVLDANQVSNLRIIDVNSSDALLTGFSLINAKSTDWNSKGLGIKLTDGVVSNCVVSNFTGNANALGVWMLGGLITDSTIDDMPNNTGAGACGGILMSGGTLRSSTVRGCHGRSGGGIQTSGSVTVEVCNITHNFSWGAGGGIQIRGNAAVRDCVFAYNTNDNNGGSSSYKGGGLHLQSGYQVNIDVARCTIVSNVSRGDGGGLSYINAGDTVSVRNTLVAQNSATGDGGGVRVVLGAGNPSLIAFENCTVADNSADGSADGIYLNADSGARKSIYTNMIVYHNGSEDLNITNGFSFSCSPSLTSGDGNVTGDPLFTDLANGDYTLKFGSPAIDSGTNQTWMIGATDLAGSDRIINDIVDMGALESAAEGPQGTVIYVR